MNNFPFHTASSQSVTSALRHMPWWLTDRWWFRWSACRWATGWRIRCAWVGGMWRHRISARTKNWVSKVFHAEKWRTHLNEVIHDADGYDDGEEPGRWVRNHHQHRQNVEEHHNPESHAHWQHVVNHVNVLWESIEDSAEWGGVEEGHRKPHCVLEQLVVQVAGRSETTDGENHRSCEESKGCKEDMKLIFKNSGHVAEKIRDYKATKRWQDTHLPETIKAKLQ